MVESRVCPKVQLFISCRKLKDTDTFSKSDPYVEVSEKSRDGQWALQGFTEIIDNNLNPDFVKNFELNYLFEEQQYLKFRVFDSNDGKISQKNRDFIGEADCTLGEIIGAQGQQTIKTLKSSQSSKSTGNIILRCEQVTENNDAVMMQITGRDLEDTSGFFHGFKPFFYLSRAMESGGNQRIYMSEHVKSKNVAWKLFEKSMKDLCNGDPTRPIYLEVYDNHSSGSHDYHSTTEFSIQKITEEGVKQFPLINQKKKSKKNYKNSGMILINSCQIIKNYTLLDFIRGGCQINLTIAVDFTGSNGIPTSPQSLHFMNPSGMNLYEQALFAVSDILLQYDSDKQVPLYGFGGKINGQTSHCFNMNFNPSDPRVFGIDGIMSAYRNSLRYVELSGPTLFAHVLAKTVCEVEAQQVSQFNQQYNVLLILTDGEIHDMNETVNWVVRGSSQPLSIVIVGIGNDSFTNMIQLDADDMPLMDNRGKKMERDIVQFVPFREVGNSPGRLAKEVLEEIPREVSNFFKMRNIFPNAAIPAPDYDFNRSYTIAENHPPGYQNVPEQGIVPEYQRLNPGHQTLPPQQNYSQVAPPPYGQPPNSYQTLPPKQGYEYVPPKF